MLKKNAVIKKAAKSKKSLNAVEALLKKVKKSASYTGTQQNLYSYADLGWDNYFLKLLAFTDHSTMYTQALGDSAKAAIVAAAALDNFEALSDAHSVARNDLIKLLEVVLSMWQDAKGYAIVAFNAADLPSKLKAAGSGSYKAAAGRSWDSAAELIRMCKLSLTTNSVALLANGNMPITFAADFTTAATAFSAQRQVFILKEKAAIDGIAAKFEANEAVYASLVMMTNAGKAIYRKNALERRNFVINTLKKGIRGNSPSGIKGVITKGTSPAMPLEGVRISDQEDPTRFTTTAEDGSYELKIASGIQNILVELAGFVPQELQRIIDVGTMHRQSFSLVAEPIVMILGAGAPVIIQPGRNSDLLS